MKSIQTLFIALYVSLNLQALPLDHIAQSNIPVGSTIGVFCATFDPLTYEHMVIIDAALKAGHFNHIVVIPVGFNPTKMSATPYYLRNKFVEAVYEKNPHVFYSPNLSAAQAINLLRQKGYQTMGVALLPDLNGFFLFSFLKRMGVGFSMPVDHWLIVAETKAEYDNFPYTVIFRKRTFLEHKMPASSQIVRKYFEKERPAQQYLLDLDASKTLPVPVVVANIILDNYLYFPSIKDVDEKVEE